MTRRQMAGAKMADAIFELCNMMYNVNTAKGVIYACIDRLNKRLPELKSKKATPDYKQARYGNKKEDLL